MPSSKDERCPETQELSCTMAHCTIHGDDDAEGERRFTIPINPDPVTQRVRAEAAQKTRKVR